METVPRTPLLYEAGIVIIGQGHKIGWLGDRTFRFDKDSFLIALLALGYPAETPPAPPRADFRTRLKETP